MEKRAVKFGGTSLCDAAQMQKAAEIVRADPRRCAVVVSAPGKRMRDDEKITDVLLRMEKARTFAERNAIFKTVEARFDAMIKELSLPLDFSEEYRYIREEAFGDFLISRGEYFCAVIFAALLGFAFIDAGEVIFFKENGATDTEKTRKIFSERLEKTPYAVIPGFYGRTEAGGIRLFPRGGSDITGALAADALHASLYENFTDVSGFLLTDPRIIPHAATVPCLSYGELRKLSSMGAFVLHADAILPLCDKKIPVVIRNTNEPEGACTVIGERVSPHTVGGIVGGGGYTLFSVFRTGIGERIEELRAVLALFERYTKMIYSVPHAVDAVGILVKSEDIRKSKDILIRALTDELAAEKVVARENIALLSVVGEGSAEKYSSLILHAMQERGAVPILLDSGADTLGMTVGFDEKYLEMLISDLYLYAEKDLFR